MAYNRKFRTTQRDIQQRLTRLDTLFDAVRLQDSRREVLRGHGGTTAPLRSGTAPDGAATVGGPSSGWASSLEAADDTNDETGEQR